MQIFQSVMKRIFIAVKIKLNEKSQQVFSECKFRLRDEKIKWVDPLNMHITLKFIGDTYENEIADIHKNSIINQSGILILLILHYPVSDYSKI